MRVFVAGFIPILAVLPALGAHTLPAVAQDVFHDLHTDDRKARTHASLRFANFLGSQSGVISGGVAMPPGGGSATLDDALDPLAPIALHTNRNPNRVASPGLPGWTANATTMVERAGAPELGSMSDLDPGLHQPAFREATIANILQDLRKEYGPQSMTQPGDFHWFFESQRSLTTGNKNYNLVACNKMSRQSSFCASTDAKSFNVSFRVF